MPYDKLVDSAQLDNAITQTANAIREKTGSADLIDWNADTGFADAIGSLGGASGGNVSYQSGYRINSSGEQIAYDGYATSDYISCELNNVVYLLNIYMESGVENAGNLRIAFYDSDKVHLGQTNATGAGDNLNGKYEVTDGSLSQFTVKSFTDCDLTNVKYFRLCSTELDGDSVVIVTESGGGSGGGDTGGDDLAIKIIERTLVDEPLPEGLTKIGHYAFNSCTNLALTSLPDGVTHIGNNAFQGCTNLALTSLPEEVTSISAYAFSNCTGLTTITFKGKPSSIANTTFQGCTDLLTINVPWAEGEVANAPWGATKATINYNYTGE